MTKLPFDPEHIKSRIEFDMLSNGRFLKKVVLVEGPSDQQFYGKMFANTVHSRSMYSRDTVVAVCRLLREADFPCYGIVDLDYYWFHSKQNPEPENVLVLDENNLESFVLFDAKTHESWNHSGAPETLSNIIECAKLLGVFRCINHTHEQEWRFKPVSGSNNSTFHLRSEIRRMFAQNATRSPNILLANLLELYDFSEPEFDARKNEILNAPNYSLSRLINGKDLNMFLSISNMPHVYQNAADGFDLEQFRNSNLGKKLQPLGVLG
jgi:hypothetical protein